MISVVLLILSYLISSLILYSFSPIKGGVNAKELFHYYISLWIEGKRLALLDSCKLDKV